MDAITQYERNASFLVISNQLHSKAPGPVFCLFSYSKSSVHLHFTVLSVNFILIVLTNGSFAQTFVTPEQDSLSKCLMLFRVEISREIESLALETDTLQQRPLEKYFFLSRIFKVTVEQLFPPEDQS